MSWETVWITIGILVLIVEGVTLILKQRGDTFSEQVWKWSCTDFWQGVVFAAMFWLFYHFIVDPYFFFDLTGQAWDDILIALFGFVVGWFMPRPKWRGNCKEGLT